MISSNYKVKRVLQFTSGKIRFTFELIEVIGYLWLLNTIIHNYIISQTPESLIINLSGAFLFVLLPLGVIGVGKVGKLIMTFLEIYQS